MEENKEKSISTMNFLDVRQPFKVQEVIDNVKSNILEGNVNPLEAFTVLKRMAKISEEVIKDANVKRMAEEEIDKYVNTKQKSVQLFSATITKCPTYTWHDYSECGHDVLNKLMEIQKEVALSIKAIEEELKLMVVSEQKQAALFGLENTNKDIIFAKIPSLVWDDYGIVGSVAPPRKIQTIGLKYMKI